MKVSLRRHVYAAYTIIIEPLPNGDSYRATFAAGVPSPPGEINHDWKIIAPRLPMSQISWDGDSIPVLIYEDAKTGQRLVDYIHVLGSSQLTLRTDSARDTYSDDAELNLVQPILRINGAATQASALHETYAQTLSIDIPGQGSFTLSFKPLVGSQLMGEASGNSLTFAWNDDLFRIDCSARISSSGSAPYHVYVRH